MLLSPQAGRRPSRTLGHQTCANESIPVRLLLVLLLLLLLPPVSWGQGLTGRVVRVIDGDKLVVLDATSTQHKIRLAGTDCPERKQAWSTKAKQALSDYVYDHQVTVD